MPFRVLHAGHMRQIAVGVLHQMEYEQLAATELGIDWVASFYCGTKTDSPVAIQTPSGNGLIQSKRDYYGSLLDRASNFDVILLRYAMYDPLQLWFIHKCPIPVVTMHHTLEIPELLAYKNLRSTLLAQAERLIGPFTLRKAAAIVGVTWEIANVERSRSRDLNKPLFQYGNGAIYSDDCVIPLKTANKPYQFLFLASQFPVWTGLDLLMDAASQSTDDFKVHLVGNLSHKDKQALSADSRFVLHGTLDRPAIENLMGQCVLGLGIFALERNGFTEGNTLKVREYLCAGLPVYAGHKEIFDDDFPYYRNGPVDFAKIIEYADQVVKVSRSTVSEAARPIIDKSVVLANIYKDLQSVAKHD